MSITPRPQVEELTPEPREGTPFASVGESSTMRPEELQNEASGSTQRTMSDNTSNEPHIQLPPSGMRPTGPHQARVAQDVPMVDEVDRELQELEAWHEKATKLQRVARLREAQAKYLAGDTNALQTTRGGIQLAATVPTVSTAGLPRPEPPHVFTKRNRADYNRWKRDCERYFERLPANFPQEVQKVDFGAQYLSETMKSLWEAHRADQLRLSPLWAPTWVTMKAVMLGSLGTLSERRQWAYEALSKARMFAHSNPTELLDYMRPYWEELGDTHGPALQVMGYIHALPEDIQKQLFMYPLERRETLTQVEEAANRIFRQRTSSKNHQGEKPQKEHKSGKNGSKGEGGSKETPKRSKGGSPGHYDRKRTKGGKPKPEHANITCYLCKEVGHYASDCPNPEKSKKSKEGSDPGKGKGQKV